MSQEKNESNSHNLVTLELLQLCCMVLRVILALCPEDTAKVIGKRLSLFARGGFLPGGKTRYDTSAMAGLLNMSEPGLRRMASRNSIPSTKPGESHYWTPDDFNGPHAVISDEPESGEVVPTGCLEKQKRKIVRRKPRKK